MSCSSSYCKVVGEDPKRLLSPVLHWHKLFVLIAPAKEEDLNEDI